MLTINYFDEDIGRHLGIWLRNIRHVQMALKPNDYRFG